jgi:general L-amino acid transport system permease protein
MKLGFTMNEMFSFWYKGKFRRIFFQALAIVIFAGFGFFLYYNTSTNLARLNIAPGFEFMDEIAGFMPTTTGMNLTGFDLNKSTHGDVFVVGMFNTLIVAIMGVIFATILGFVMGILRLSKNLILSFVASAYVEGMRNVPLLLWILIWYFGIILAGPSVRGSLSFFDIIFINKRYVALPQPLLTEAIWMILGGIIAAIVFIFFLKKWADQRRDQTGRNFPVFWVSIGVIFFIPLILLNVAGLSVSWEYPILKGFNYIKGIQLPGSYMAMVLALSFYTGAYIAEIVRAGILAVTSGQIDAARSIGLRPGQISRFVVIPQALRVIVPPLTSQYLSLTKNSSLAVAIGYTDLVNVFTGISMMQTGNALEIIMLTMLFYASVSLFISLFMNWFNRRVAIVER